jgi:hypothetical protein
MKFLELMFAHVIRSRVAVISRLLFFTIILRRFCLADLCFVTHLIIRLPNFFNDSALAVYVWHRN